MPYKLNLINRTEVQGYWNYSLRHPTTGAKLEFCNCVPGDITPPLVEQPPEECTLVWSVYCSECPPGQLYVYIEIESPIPANCIPILLYDGVRVPENKTIRRGNTIGMITIDECNEHIITLSLLCDGGSVR